MFRTLNVADLKFSVTFIYTQRKEKIHRIWQNLDSVCVFFQIQLMSHVVVTSLNIVEVLATWLSGEYCLTIRMTNSV